MKKSMWCLLALVSTSAFAADGSIELSSEPRPMVLGRGGNSSSFFNLTLQDMGKQNAKKFEIEEIQWEATHFPGYAKESRQLCYHGPDDRTNEQCVTLEGDKGVVKDFKGKAFGARAQASIKHEASDAKNATQPDKKPAGPDKVTFRFNEVK